MRNNNYVGKFGKNRRKSNYLINNKVWWFTQDLNGNRKYFTNRNKAKNYIKHKNIEGYFLGRYNREKSNYLKGWFFKKGSFIRSK